MTKTVVYTYDVPGIMCTSCRQLIMLALKDKDFVKHVSVDVANKKAIVRCTSETNPYDPLLIIQNCAVKFKSATLESTCIDEEVTFYGSLKNLDEDNTRLLKKIFNENESLISEAKIWYSTKSLTLKLHAKDDIEKVRALLNEHDSLRQIEILPVEVPVKQDNKQKESKAFFRKASLNFLIGIPFWAVSLLGLIPSPLQPIGQLFGLGVGLLTLGLMHSTGKDFYKDAWDQFYNHRQYNMNTLIAIGTGAAWVYSMMMVLYPWGFIASALHYEFLAINLILGILNAGKGVRASLQEKTRDKVANLNDEFMKLQPLRVRRVKNFEAHITQKVPLEFEDISFENIDVDDILEVKVDEGIPVDGSICHFHDDKKQTTVNQETLTGETNDKAKYLHDTVTSGGVNTSHSFFLKANCKGTEGTLYKIIQNTQKFSDGNEMSMSKTIDKLAIYFVPAILLIAAGTGFGWLLLNPGQISLTIQAVLSVLLCACPCTLGLATPITTNISVNQLYQHGVIVLKARALESCAKVTDVVFDKTGTLTSLEHKLTYAHNTEKHSGTELIKLVASLEASSAHPIAEAFRSNEDLKANIKDDLLSVVSFDDTIPGGICGVLATKNGNYLPIKICNRPPDDEASMGQDYASIVTEAKVKSWTKLFIYLGKETAEKPDLETTKIDEFVGIMTLAHQPKKDALDTIKFLRERNINIHLLSGDEEEPTTKIANTFGIPLEQVRWDCGKPTAKGKVKSKDGYINALRRVKAKRGIDPVIAMVGDGVNDIDALKVADVPIACGPWTPASTQADIAIQKLSHIIDTICVAEKAMHNIHWNLRWTGLYNLFSLFASTGLLYALCGITVSPIFASLGMAISSIVVVYNSNSLLGKLETLFKNQTSNRWNDAYREVFTHPKVSHSPDLRTTPRSPFDPPQQTMLNSAVYARVTGVDPSTMATTTYDVDDDSLKQRVQKI